MLFFPIWFNVPPGFRWGKKRKKDGTMDEKNEGDKPTLARVINPSLAGRKANLPGIEQSVRFDAKGISEPIPEEVAHSLYEAGYRVVSLDEGTLPERELGIAVTEPDSGPGLSVEQMLEAERTAHAANVANAVKERDAHWKRAIDIEAGRNQTLVDQLERFQRMTAYIEVAEPHTPTAGLVRLVLVEGWRDRRDEDGAFVAVKVMSPLDLSEEPTPAITITNLSSDPPSYVVIPEGKVENPAEHSEPADTDGADEDKSLEETLNSLPTVGGAPSLPDNSALRQSPPAPPAPPSIPVANGGAAAPRGSRRSKPSGDASPGDEAS